MCEMKSWPEVLSRHLSLGCVDAPTAAAAASILCRRHPTVVDKGHLTSTTLTKGRRG